jgi:hypothetical protein
VLPVYLTLGLLARLQGLSAMVVTASRAWGFAGLGLAGCGMVVATTLLVGIKKKGKKCFK